MARVVKKVATIVPPNERSQVFTNTDTSNGDILMVKESLGHPASKVLIEAISFLSFRLNVLQEVYPQQSIYDVNYNPWAPGLDLSNVMTVTGDWGATHVLHPSDTFSLDNDMPVNDIQVIIASGVYSITVM